MNFKAGFFKTIKIGELVKSLILLAPQAKDFLRSRQN
jgi:hypothetical protein